MRLHDIAHARAGDKGTTSDITVIAYRAEDFELLRREVTADRVRAHFADIVRGEVQRFELPRLRALKFVLHNTLGGVTRTLDLDIHGKSLSSSLLELDVTDTAQQMAEMMRQFAAAGGMRPGAPTATVDDPFFTYDRPTEFDAHSETVNVPMRDGSYLVCDLLRPAGPGGQPAEGAFPGIVYDFNAYGARVVFASGAAPFVERGYVALVPSVRGSGDSPATSSRSASRSRRTATTWWNGLPRNRSAPAGSACRASATVATPPCSPPCSNPRTSPRSFPCRR